MCNHMQGWCCLYACTEHCICPLPGPRRMEHVTAAEAFCMITLATISVHSSSQLFTRLVSALPRCAIKGNMREACNVLGGQWLPFARSKHIIREAQPSCIPPSFISNSSSRPTLSPSEDTMAWTRAAGVRRAMSQQNTARNKSSPCEQAKSPRPLLATTYPHFLLQAPASREVESPTLKEGNTGDTTTTW